jgi:hypothetical protein
MTSTKYEKTPKEQVAYANLLFYGCWTGLALMVVTYLIYAFGILEPHVSMATVIEVWSKPVHEYLTIGKVPVGWGWAGLLNKGDFLNFLGIALLAGMTLLCYIPLVRAYIRKKDTLFAAIAIGEILVLAFAASGIVGGGGH